MQWPMELNFMFVLRFYGPVHTSKVMSSKSISLHCSWAGLEGSTSVVVPYCYLFLLSIFILWFSYYVSDIFCKF